MDRIMMILAHANAEAIKEPRGFIKFLQIIIAICAFATAVNNSSYTAFNYTCNSTSNPNATEAEPVKDQKLAFSYPYNLEESTKFNVPLCPKFTNITNHKEAHCYGDFSGRSQLFVFVGVIAFLYSLFMVIFYVLADDKYHQVAMIPNTDFVVTIIFAILWFVFSSAWADGVVKIKHYTDPNTLFLDNPYNEANLPECLPKNSVANCLPDPHGTGEFRNLNISIIFGYLCCGVWIGNLWFLYKETKWYKDKHAATQQGSQNMPSPSSEFP